MLAALKTSAGIGADDEIEMALALAAKNGTLAKRLNDPELPLVELMKLADAHLSEDERKGLKTPDAVKAAILGKAKMPAAHADKMQAIHDHAASMGATCSTEKRTDAADLAKGGDLAAQLTKALADIETLKKQPMPHSVIFRTAPAKGQETQDRAKDRVAAIVQTIGFNDPRVVKFADSTIDWASTELRLAQESASDALTKTAGA
jgi:hypothetical protein